jgi:hypothetical protein
MFRQNLDIALCCRHLTAVTYRKYLNGVLLLDVASEIRAF